jgi:hypothetical protein
MLTDHQPNVTDSDEYIRSWVRNSGQVIFLVTFVELSGQVDPFGPDVARIDFHLPGEPVTRVKWPRYGV